MSRRSFDRANPNMTPFRSGDDKPSRSGGRPTHRLSRSKSRNYQRCVFKDNFVRPSDARVVTDSRLSASSYALVVLLTGSLAVVQFYFLPRNLGAAEFGLAVLGLSVTQAALQFTDVGLINASLRSDISDDVRVALRAHAVSISHILCVVFIIISCGVGAAGTSFGYIAAAGFACALFLIGGRTQASAAVHMSDEKTATRHNILWQNSPKIGSVLGSFGGTATASMVAAVATSALFGRPHLPRRIRFSFLRLHRWLWLPGIAVSASGFLLTWVDTYTLSILSGVTDAGNYQAIVRPLTGITYIYLPIIALIQSAFNAGNSQRVKLLMASCVALGVAGSTLVAAFLIIFGHEVWPGFAFDHRTVLVAAVAAVAMCVATVLGGQLLLRGHHLAAAINTSLGAIILAIVSVVTVRAMGTFGAGLASALAATFVVAAHGTVLLTKNMTERVSTRP